MFHWQLVREGRKLGSALLYLVRKLLAFELHCSGLYLKLGMENFIHLVFSY